MRIRKLWIDGYGRFAGREFEFAGVAVHRGPNYVADRGTFSVREGARRVVPLGDIRAEVARAAGGRGRGKDTPSNGARRGGRSAEPPADGPADERSGPPTGSDGDDA